MNDTVIKTAELASTGPKIVDTSSMWDIFIHADFISQVDLTILFICSVWVWAIIFDKFITVKRLNSYSSVFEENFWSGESLEKLFDRVKQRPADPMTSVFVSGMKEWRRTSGRQPSSRNTGGGISPHAGLIQRIERVMTVCISREMARAERYMTVLATIASVSPFLGLFGTVWGVMESFSALAGTSSNSVAAVAPGIAAALSTTALGLIAAIPAVVGYNKFNNDLSRYGDRLESFATEFSSILARHLEEAE